MAYQIGWLVEGFVIATTFSGTTTAEELEEQARAFVDYLDHGQGELVHTLFDLAALESFPMNLSVLNHALSAPLHHPKIGWTIFITSDRMAKFLASTLLQIASVRHRFFETREEGLAFLNEVDGTLPNLFELRRNNDL